MIDGIIILEHIRTCQNHVFKVILNGDTYILRLSEPAHRSVERLQTEINLLTDLQLATTLTIVPMRFPSGKLIDTVTHEGMHYFATIFPFVNGSPSNIKSESSAFYFGSLLAQLHTVLAGLENQYNLPVSQNKSSGKRYLIHGDFNPTNVLTTNTSSTIIDFEDACYSTYEYELANSIYMIMFDYRHNPIQFRDSGFISGFLGGYTDSREIDLQGIRTCMDERVSMLQQWLTEPSSAPLSIASSSESWKQELTNFVMSYLGGAFKSIVDCII